MMADMMSMMTPAAPAASAPKRKAAKRKATKKKAAPKKKAAKKSDEEEGRPEEEGSQEDDEEEGRRRRRKAAKKTTKKKKAAPKKKAAKKTTKKKKAAPKKKAAKKSDEEEGRPEEEGSQEEGDQEEGRQEAVSSFVSRSVAESGTDDKRATPLAPPVFIDGNCGATDAPVFMDCGRACRPFSVHAVQAAARFEPPALACARAVFDAGGLAATGLALAATGLAGAVLRGAACACLPAPLVATARLVRPPALRTGTTSLVTRTFWPGASASLLRPFHAFNSCAVTPYRAAMTAEPVALLRRVVERAARREPS